MHTLVVLVAVFAGIAEANPEKTFILPGGAEIEMVWIKPGTFVMGTDEETFEKYRRNNSVPDPTPPHQVALTQGFWMGKYKLTARQWDAVADLDLPENFELPPLDEWANFYLSEDQAIRFFNEHKRKVYKWGDDSPITGVRWWTATFWIAELNALEGHTLWRLPTEAEWEYACRAGTTTLWFWGDDYSEADRYVVTQDSPERLPNPWGLYDMLGRGGEWCQDWYAAYPNEPQTDPLQTVPELIRFADTCWEEEHCYAKMYRGTTFTHPDYSAKRGTLDPGIHSYMTALRLVRDDPERAVSVTPETWGQIKKRVRT